MKLCDFSTLCSTVLEEYCINIALWCNMREVSVIFVCHIGYLSYCSYARSLSPQTKARVDGFKELQGLIAALFNPGLRDRHWEKMSAIAGQDLRPTEVSFSLSLSLSWSFFLRLVYDYNKKWMNPLSSCWDNVTKTIAQSPAPQKTHTDINCIREGKKNVWLLV